MLWSASLSLVLTVILLNSLCYGQEANDKSSTGSAGLNVTGVDPEDNDFVHCNPIYAVDLNADGCRKAAAKIYPGRIPKWITFTKSMVPLWFADDDDGVLTYAKPLPQGRFLLSNGFLGHPTCNITIDFAGYSDSTKYRAFNIRFRQRIKDLVDFCVPRAGWGGFATYGIDETGATMSHVKPFPPENPRSVSKSEDLHLEPSQHAKHRNCHLRFPLFRLHYPLCAQLAQSSSRRHGSQCPRSLDQHNQVAPDVRYQPILHQEQANHPHESTC